MPSMGLRLALGGRGGAPIAAADPISFVGSSFSVASGTGDVTATVPADYAEGDILIIQVECGGNGSLSTPAGWTLIGSAESGSTGAFAEAKVAGYWKRAGASESSVLYTDTGDHTTVKMSAWRNCIATGSPIDASASNFNGTASMSTTFPTLTTLTDAAMVVILATVGDTTTYTDPTSADLESITIAYQHGTVQGGDGTLALLYGTMATAGAVNGSVAHGNEQSACVAFSLKPAA